jgi:hypothetical protein
MKVGGAMSTLKAHEKAIFERLFDRGGYVLNFSDATFAEFFREHGVNINEQKYRVNGNSKMKRLRTFWEVEPDLLVGKVLSAMLEYACVIDTVPPEGKDNAAIITNRLIGKSNATIDKSPENDFLEKTFPNLDLQKLVQDQGLQSILEHRIHEIHRSIHSAPLATIFLCGSTLEGLLLDVACDNPKLFNCAKSAQKKNGQVLPLPDWNLSALIDTAHEIGFIGLDIKTYSHSLRNFRNYIHPRAQAVQQFTPDHYTARISWQVLQAAIADLSKKRQR